MLVFQLFSMKIIYKNPYLSITSFKSVETPSFLVITGVNGSGKTHLLKAIEQQSVVIEGYESKTIVYFNYLNFYLENESIFNAQSIAAERNNAWNYFNQQIKGNIISWKNTLVGFQNSYDLLIDICTKKIKSLWDLTKDDIGNDAISQQFNNYKQNISNLFTTNQNFKNNNQAQAIYILLRNLPYSIDEINETDFMEQYRPYNFKNNFLPLQLGNIFWDYFMRLRENEFHVYENKEKGKKYKTLSEEKFIKKYGQKPWVVVSSILEKFNSLEYKINSPEDYSYTDNYQLKLQHTKKGINVEFDKLSSGERVLMALVASIYKLSSDSNFPEVILLDEVDASLHPSMIKNLIEVIDDVFVKKGTQVILVTHSPTTVALAPEESIYVMNKDGEDRLVKKPKSEALEILTEGYATLDKGVKLFDQISKKRLSIITEGKNTKYLLKALDLFGKAYKDDIEIISGAEDSSGKEQLKTLFNFFCKVGHDKKVVFVWDCYTTFNLLRTNNTIPFIFVKNDKNSKVTRGIENLFDSSNFKDEFYDKKDKPDGGSHLDLNKEKFQQNMLQNGSEKDFENFNPLFSEIEKILKE